MSAAGGLQIVQLNQICLFRGAAAIVLQGKLLASINNRVQLYGWAQREGGARELAAECGHSGHVCALCVETRGDFILVGERVSELQTLVLSAATRATCVRCVWRRVATSTLLVSMKCRLVWHS